MSGDGMGYGLIFLLKKYRRILDGFKKLDV
jgi:hypothetical protein